MDFRAYEAAPGISVIVLPDAPVYTHVAVSNDFTTASGLKREDVLHKSHFSVFPKNTDDPNSTGELDLKASFESVITNKAPHEIPVQRYDIRNGDGSFSQRYWKINNAPILDEEGNVQYIIHTALDITAEVLAEQKIQSSGSIEKAYNFFMNAPVIIGLVKGDSYTIEMANEGLLEVWGRTAEVIGKPLVEAIPELEAQGFVDLLDGVRTTGESFFAYEFPITLIRNGKEEVLYFDFVYKPFYEDEKEGKASGVISVGHDVTAQVLVRKALEERNKEFQFVTDFMPQMIWVTRPDGYHYYYNKQWYDYTGLTHGETEGTGWNDVFHPDDQQRAWSLWKHSLETGDPYEIEYRCRRFDGVYRWVLGRALPFRDESGTILKWFGTCTDVHDQKMAVELLDEKVRERTRELEHKNREMEQFTYAASHDMQEPLRKVQTFSSFLLQESGDMLDERGKLYLTKINDSVNRMKAIIDGLLQYSHQTKEDRQFIPVDLNVIIQIIKEDLDMLIEERGAIITADKLPVIRAVPTQMNQLFSNLLTNAIKFSRPEVAPEIIVGYAEVKDEQFLKEKGLDQSKPYVLISVKDNGIGFEQQYAEQIFKLFKRLHGKAEYAGTGIGLSLCKKILENHEGVIWAESKTGEGATFKILLPAE